MRLFVLLVGLLGLSGCQMGQNYIVKEEYVEHEKWDKKEGLIKHYEASFHWKAKDSFPIPK